MSQNVFIHSQTKMFESVKLTDSLKALLWDPSKMDVCPVAL